MKLNTVNVIETINEDVRSIRSFTDDAEGNKQAEELFANCFSENGGESVALNFHLEEGYYSSGSYGLFIVHSS